MATTGTIKATIGFRVLLWYSTLWGLIRGNIIALQGFLQRFRGFFSGYCTGLQEARGSRISRSKAGVGGVWGLGFRDYSALGYRNSLVD